MNSNPGEAAEPKVNILLVDDDPDDLAAVVSALDGEGYNLIKAQSGPAAFQCLEKMPFAMIILDVFMPGMDGMEAATMIRKRESTRHTPIIFLTGTMPGEQQIFKGYATGAIDYLLKPVAPQILKYKVAAFAELSRKTRLLEETNQQLIRAHRELARSSSAEIRASEEKFRVIAETAMQGIVTCDRSGNIAYFNPAAERMFGYSADEIVGQPLTRLIPERYHHLYHDEALNRLLSGDNRADTGLEISVERRDGAQFPIELSYAGWEKGNQVYLSAIVTDITHRKKLEKAILEVSDREQRKIAQDLHDGLTQQLTGIAYMAGSLEKRLAAVLPGEAPAAAKIYSLLNEAIDQGRSLARGLFPVKAEANGLMAALEELSESVSGLFKVSCKFECPAPVLLKDTDATTHLYRIAQEAVHNAVRHGRARRIEVWLIRRPDEIALEVRDDGDGISKDNGGKNGMGLHIMDSRARTIGAVLNVRRGDKKGTVVSCCLAG
ncbi:PAS domain S-box protein [bacterium]|nr:PAS domain S-box protein [bacterium]